MSVMGRRDSPTSNPCVGRCSHCVGDFQCRGCGRTVPEVLNWNTLTDDEKIEIKAQLPQRLGK